MGLFQGILFTMALVWMFDFGLVTVRKNVGEGIPSTWYERFLFVFLGPIALVAAIFVSGNSQIAMLAAMMTGGGAILTMKVFWSAENDKDKWTFIRYGLYCFITVNPITFLRE